MRFTLLALLAIVSGCKIAVQIPTEGAYVTTESGRFQCNSGEYCEVSVTDTNFDETFVAVSTNPDLEFIGWRRHDGGLCGGSDKPCHVSTAGFDLFDSLMSLINDPDFTLRLIPVFRSGSAVEHTMSYEAYRYPYSDWGFRFAPAYMSDGTELGWALDRDRFTDESRAAEAFLLIRFKGLANDYFLSLGLIDYYYLRPDSSILGNLEPYNASLSYEGNSCGPDQKPIYETQRKYQIIPHIAAGPDFALYIPDPIAKLEKKTIGARWDPFDQRCLVLEERVEVKSVPAIPTDIKLKFPIQVNFASGTVSQDYVTLPEDYVPTGGR